MAATRKWYGRGDVGRVRRMAADGYGIADVAAEYGVSRSAVKRFCAKYDIRFHWGGVPNPDHRVRVIACVQMGLVNCGQIGRAMGRRRGQVLRWVRELERAGAIRRMGKTKGTRLSVSPSWSTV